MERILALQNLPAVNMAFDEEVFGDSTRSEYCSSQSVARCSSVSNQCQSQLTEEGGW